LDAEASKKLNETESEENENDLNYGEDPIEKINKWKKSKNIVDGPSKKLRDVDSPRDNTEFSPWVESESSDRYFKNKNNKVLKQVEPEPDLLEEIDLEVLASRNFECLLDYEG